MFYGPTEQVQKASLSCGTLGRVRTRLLDDNKRRRLVEAYEKAGGFDGFFRGRSALEIDRMLEKPSVRCGMLDEFAGLSEMICGLLSHPSNINCKALRDERPLNWQV